MLDGNDLDALRKLRDDPAAGLSPAGLPRRVLAGFRIFEQTRDPADAQVLVAIATVDAPSVLTPRVFDKVDERALQERWERGEQARAIFGQHPDVTSSGKWIIGQDEAWWLSPDGKELHFLAPAAIQTVLATVAKRLPAWADLRLLIDGAPLPGGRLQGGEIMESVPGQFFGSQLRLEILAARPELFEAAARQQGRWTLALLAFAVVISGGALFFIHRAVERERRLNAMKSDFVASVSHELRAPVASIRLMADALDAGKIEPHTVQ